MVASQQARKFYPGIADAYRIIRVLSTYSDVVACSPIVEGRAFLRLSLIHIFREDKSSHRIAGWETRNS